MEGAGLACGEVQQRVVRFADATSHQPPPQPNPVMMMDDLSFVFPESAVQVSSQVLGRGAYGEVRVGTWRNCQIACKRLHAAAATDDLVLSDDVDALHREISMLSRMRHPNLVMFLGACFDKKTKQPTILLTELMSVSLYDIVEVQKISLTLPEVLDISRDVSLGLAYLHSHDPAVIHRDISCKNILLQGNSAKIADLGQARFFRPGPSSSSSRASSLNTQNSRGLPGAMAYTAPEVLSGTKYSEKLDLFSLGVLLVQMITGEYPRIEARELQMKAAVKAMPPFSSLVYSLLSFLPSERPNASEVCTDLEAIRANDRFYPLSRMSPGPESQVGITSRRWVDALVVTTNEALSKKIHQSYAMLQAEGRRWQDQYRRADSLEASVATLQEQLEYVSDKFLATTNDLEALQSTHAATETELAALRESNERQVSTLSTEKAALTDLVRSLEHQLFEARENMSGLGALVPELETRLRLRDDALFTAKAEARQNSAEIKTLQRRLEEQEQDSAEMEVRLEQALVRWKKEQETSQEVKLDFIKLRITCSSLVEHKQRLEAELKQTQGWLKAREEAQLPDSVQEQIDRLQHELTLSAEAGERLILQREAMEQQVGELQHSAEGLREALLVSDAAVVSKEKLLAGKEALIGRLRLELTELEEDLKRHESEAAEREEGLRKELLAVKSGQGQGQGQTEQAQGEKQDERPESPTTAETPEDTAPRCSPVKFSFGDLIGAAEKTNKYRENYEAGAAERAAKAAAAAKLDQEKAAKVRVKHTEDLHGAEGLAKLFIEQSEDHCMLWRAARSLRPLVNKDSNNRALCLTAGVDVAAVQALQRYPDLAVVQGQVLQLLGALAYGADSVRRRAGERGALVCIERALMSFGHDELVLLHALTALTNLSHNSPDNRHRFLEAKGMEALTAVMDAFIASPKVQRQGCWAILTLAGSDDTGRLVAQAGGGTVVVNAMLSHRGEAGVQQFGLWAISNMALAGGDVTRRLRKGGCLEACRIALESHAGDAEVVRQARHMMSILGPPPPAIKGK